MSENESAPLFSAEEALKLAKEYPERAREKHLRRILESVKYQASCGLFRHVDQVPGSWTLEIVDKLRALGYAVVVVTSGIIRSDIRISWDRHEKDGVEEDE